MIIKKKIVSIKSLKIFNNIISKVIYFFGAMTLILFIISTIYYFNSGMKNDYQPKELIKKIDRIIFDKYIGFSLFEIDDYFLIKFSSLKYLFLKNKLEDITILIDQKNLFVLESQRKKKLENKLFKFDQFADASLRYKDKNYNIKMRIKGDRSLHWEDKNKTSYKIDLKGDPRLFGLEEFSVQKPITRNYIYEFIFHKLLESNDLISLKYHFVNLKLNDTDQGIYALEEGFSKELIERNKKRNGPIFGLNEEDGVEYPNVFYDIYSEKYWKENNPELVKNAFAKLNLIKRNEIDLNDLFDLEKWAKFFAVIDFSNALHGSLSKSVKLFYNPASGKFEPIGFDGHYFENNIANDFIILDFLNPNNKSKCNHICYDRNWYLKFLKKSDGSVNEKFINLYLEELKKISSEIFLVSFKEKYLDEIKFYNSQFLSETSNKDRSIYKGLGYFIFDKDYLENRKNYIQKRLAEIDSNKLVKLTLYDNKIRFYSRKETDLKKIITKCNGDISSLNFLYPNGYMNFNSECEYFLNDNKLNIYEVLSLNMNYKKTIYSDLTESKKLVFKNNKYYLTENLIIDKNFFFPKNNELIINPGVQIIFQSESIFASEGSINFSGSEKNPIIIKGNNLGSLILRKNNYKINYTKMTNLNKPIIDDKILHGGINIIDSNLEILNTDIENSMSEDAINLVSSNSKIENLRIFNTFSDAIDIDFGVINFKNIYCENIDNDCFDVSGGKVFGEYLEANNVRDKGISFGENSIGEISLVNLKKNHLGIAVKDGSKLVIDESFLLENEFDVSVFKKKSEYGQSKLSMNKTNKTDNLNFLVGKNNNFLFEKKLFEGKIKNDFIYNLFY